MRQVTDHRSGIPGDVLNESIAVEPYDDPGSGGAHHKYQFWVKGPDNQLGKHSLLTFHQGPIEGPGVKGVSNEALLAVVIDRLRDFQSGKFSCRENAIALTKIEEAMHWLQARTKDRIVRGVEGKEEK